MSVSIIDTTMSVVGRTGEILLYSGALFSFVGYFFPEAMEPYRKALRLNWEFIERYGLISLLDQTIDRMVKRLRQQSLIIFNYIMQPLPLVAMLIVSPILSYQANSIGAAAGEIEQYALASAPWALILLTQLIAASVLKNRGYWALMDASDPERAFESKWNVFIRKMYEELGRGPEFFKFWDQKDKAYENWIEKVETDADEFVATAWWRGPINMIVMGALVAASIYVPYALHGNLLSNLDSLTNANLAVIIILIAPQIFAFVFSMFLVWRLSRMAISLLWWETTLYQTTIDVQSSGLWAISFVVAFLASILVTFFAVQLGIAIQSASTYETTAQLLISNYVADGLTLVSTVMILSWALKGNSLLKLPLAIPIDIAIAGFLAMTSLVASHAFTPQAVDLSGAWNVLQGLSVDGTTVELGPMFWVMHTTFIPTLLYLLSILIVWYGKVFLVFTSRILRLALERDHPIEYTGGAMSALGALMIGAAV